MARSFSIISAWRLSMPGLPGSALQRREAKKETKRAVKAEQDATNQANAARLAPDQADGQRNLAISAEKRTSEVASQANVSLMLEDGKNVIAHRRLRYRNRLGCRPSSVDAVTHLYTN